ncbi:hypothetical protein [Streptomyces sp. NPDC088182]|uniref:hypothetical protein n=1 Tax=Streptomyces sp. NPDC088182 TaxID=3365838 RepID=UPI00380CB03D
MTGWPRRVHHTRHSALTAFLEGRLQLVPLFVPPPQQPYGPVLSVGGHQQGIDLTGTGTGTRTGLVARGPDTAHRPVGGVAESGRELRQQWSPAATR